MGFTWDGSSGRWVNDQGVARVEPPAGSSRNKRRVHQRRESEIQSLRHKHKWALYDSHERRRTRHKGNQPSLTAAERKVNNATWRLSLPPDVYRSLGFSEDADQALTARMGDVFEAARQREAEQRAEAERHSAQQKAMDRAAKEREVERLALESRAPERLTEGRRLAEGFVAGARVEFRLLEKYNLKTCKLLEPKDWYYTEWQDGTLKNVVADGHVKSPYGVACLEVRPDGAIPGYFLRRDQSYVMPLRSEERERAGVYECVRVKTL